MISVEKISDTKLLVNGKKVMVSNDWVINRSDLTDEELKAVEDFVQAIKRLKIKSTVR